MQASFAGRVRFRAHFSEWTDCRPGVRNMRHWIIFAFASLSRRRNQETWMRTNTARAAATAGALVALCLASFGNAAEKDFLSRFHGSFSGSGTVIRNAEDGPGKVTCLLNGQPSA